MKILFINGPNLNMLGTREPGIYGTVSYEKLIQMIQQHCNEKHITADFFQSNNGGEIVDKIWSAKEEQVEAIVMNPGALTHYSYAVADALEGAQIPAVEVHISNIHKREAFRHNSVTACCCNAQITGMGLYGYLAAIDYLCYTF